MASCFDLAVQRCYGRLLLLQLLMTEFLLRQSIGSPLQFRQQSIVFMFALVNLLQLPVELVLHHACKNF